MNLERVEFYEVTGADSWVANNWMQIIDGIEARQVSAIIGKNEFGYWEVWFKGKHRDTVRTLREAQESIGKFRSGEYV